MAIMIIKIPSEPVHIDSPRGVPPKETTWSKWGEIPIYICQCFSSVGCCFRFATCITIVSVFFWAERIFSKNFSYPTYFCSDQISLCNVNTVMIQEVFNAKLNTIVVNNDCNPGNIQWCKSNVDEKVKNVINRWIFLTYFPNTCYIYKGCSSWNPRIC